MMTRQKIFTFAGGCPSGKWRGSLQCLARDLCVEEVEPDEAGGRRRAVGQNADVKRRRYT